MNPPIVALVTRPKSHRMIKTTAIVYNIAIYYGLFTGAGAASHQPAAGGQLVVCDGNSDGHVVEHAFHTVYIVD